MTRTERGPARKGGNRDEAPAERQNIRFIEEKVD
jgi:hypothetical protein